MRTLIFALFSIASLQFSFAADQSKLLIGRWMAETVPTGYWIIDRYGDGRFAQKWYLSYDLNKASEIVVSWGRWNLKDNKYWHITEGSNSDFLNRFSGQWKATNVISISSDRFVFDSSDGHERFEVPFDSRKKLLSISMKRPKEIDFPSATSSKSVIKQPLKNIPTWVNNTAQQGAAANP